MRDPGFITIARGGALTSVDHKILMSWAILCAEHLLHLSDGKLRSYLEENLTTAKNWIEEMVSTGTAINAARKINFYVRTLQDPVEIAICRSVAHAVATAHMADHCMGSALYGLKAIKSSGGNSEEEQKWQESALQKLPDNLQRLISETINEKSKGFKL